MAKFDLSNLKLDTTRQEEPVEVETTDVVSTPSGISGFSERLTETGNQLTQQEESVDIGENSLPTFDIPEGEGIDEEKVERFIQHSASIGKSIEEIEVAYNKGLESGAFNKQVQPKRESSFEKAIEKTAEKDPSFMDKLMSAPGKLLHFGTAPHRGEEGAKEIEEVVYGTEEDPTIVKRAADTFEKRGAMGADILTRGTSGEVGALETGTLFGTNFLGTLADLVGDVVVEGFTEVTPETAKEALMKGVKTVAETKGGEKAVKFLSDVQSDMETLREVNPALAARYQGAFDFANAAIDAMGGRAIKEGGKSALKKADDVVEVLADVSNKVDVAPSGAIDRLKQGDVEFKGVPGETPTVSQIIPEKPKTKDVLDTEASDDLIRRGLKPSVQGKTTAASFDKVNADLREGIENVAKTKGIPDDGVDALRKTADRKKEVFKEIETNNDYVNLETPIAKIEDNLNTFLKSKEGKSFKAANPGIEKKINNITENWKEIYGDTMSQVDLQDLKTEFNKTLAKTDFEKILRGGDAKSLADAKISQSLGNIIDDNVMTVLGKTNKALNKEYGSLRNLEKTLARRMGVFTRNSKGGLAGLTDIFNFGDVVMGALSGSPAQVVKGGAQHLLKNVMQRGENPNVIIKQLFEMHGPKKKSTLEKVSEKIGLGDKEVTLTPKKQ